MLHATMNATHAIDPQRDPRSGTRRCTERKAPQSPRGGGFSALISRGRNPPVDATPPACSWTRPPRLLDVIPGLVGQEEGDEGGAGGDVKGGEPRIGPVCYFDAPCRLVQTDEII